MRWCRWRPKRGQWESYPRKSLKRSRKVGGRDQGGSQLHRNRRQDARQRKQSDAGRANRRLCVEDGGPAGRDPIHVPQEGRSQRRRVAGRGRVQRGEVGAPAQSGSLPGLTGGCARLSQLRRGGNDLLFGGAPIGGFFASRWGTGRACQLWAHRPRRG